MTQKKKSQRASWNSNYVICTFDLNINVRSAFCYVLLVHVLLFSVLFELPALEQPTPNYSGGRVVGFDSGSDFGCFFSFFPLFPFMIIRNDHELEQKPDLKNISDRAPLHAA